MSKSYFNQRERTNFIYLDGLITKADEMIGYLENKKENEPVVRRFRQARALLANGTKMLLEQGTADAREAVYAEVGKDGEPGKYTVALIHTPKAQEHTKKLHREEMEFRKAAVAEHGSDVYHDLAEIVVQNYCKRCDGRLMKLDGGCLAQNAMVALDIGAYSYDHALCQYAYVPYKPTEEEKVSGADRKEV